MASRMVQFYRSLLFVLLFSLGLAGAQGQTKYIRLRNEVIATDARSKASALQPEVSDAAVSGLFILQFNDRVETEWRRQLRGLGVELLRFVPEDAFIVRLDGVRPSQLRALPFVRWLGEYRTDHKLYAGLRQTQIGSATNTINNPIPISLLLSPRASPVEIAKVRRLMQTVRHQSKSRFGAVLHGDASSAQLKSLAESSSVLWIEPASQPKLLDEIATKIIAGEGLPDNTNLHAASVHQLGFDGSGVVVAVADSGLNNGDAETMHPDLAGRVDAFLFYGNLQDAADEHGHGTHVAGIVAGDGATGETDQGADTGIFDDQGDPVDTPTGPGALYGLGVAPKAHIVVQRIFDGAGGFEAPPSNEALTRDAVQAGAVIGSNSWGDDVQGRYNLNAAEFDALVRDADAETPGDQPYILEFSAGNAGPGSQTLDSPAVGKNVIATGASQNNRFNFFIYSDGQEAMADFSSRGPCEDGRIKPDVVAPGTWISSLQSASATDENAWAPISPNYQYEGGTSQAGPHVSGAAAVLVQYYRATHNGATPSPALVKAALINSAVDMDNADGTDSVPNFDEGWGRVDLTQIIGSPRRYEFVDQTELLSTTQVYERRIIVGSSAEPLKITLAYTDVPGLPAAIPALVNDLDLEVIAPDGKLYRGNQFIDGESIDGGDVGDNINNVEAVHLAAPLPGEYLVRIRARNVVEDIHQGAAAQPQQDFALVASGDLAAAGTGVLFFDRKAYSVPGLIQLKLVDLNLAGQSSVSVVLKSSTETNGEVVALQPLGSNGVFAGSVATVSGPAIADGRLQISQGDTIVASYQDLAPAGTRTATALADLLPPVITNITVTNRFGRESITWQTDEPATSLVFYGTNNLNLSFSATNRILSTDHEVALDNLTAGTTYHFFVVSADEAGNSATNTNGGFFYDFVAKPAATVLLVNAYVPDDPTLGTPAIPLTTYTDAIDQSQISYEVWDLTQPSSPSPGTNDLRPFRIVIWRLNDSLFRGGPTLSATQQKALESYVNGGGSLFISSMELLSDLGDVPFRTNVLQVRAFAEDAGVKDVLGQENDPITSGMDLALDYSAYNSDLLDLIGQSPDVSDTLTISTNAAPIFFDSVSDQVAGLRYPRTGQDSPGRVVFLSFPFDAVSGSDDAPNNRAVLMKNILSFLAPGLNGLGSVSLDRTAYTIPDRVTVEVADSDLPSGGQTSVKIFSNTETNGMLLILRETVRPGIWRGSFTLVSANNPAFSGQLRARDGDAVWAEYFDASANRTNRSTAAVDLGKPAITNIDVVAEYQEATVSWETSEPTDALVQFGESTFLGRTAYDAALAEDHEVTLSGLQPDRLYYYQVVSRDDAGNPTVDDNQGQLYTFRTLKPLSPPWSDSLDSVNSNSQTNWSVVEGELSNVNWQLGLPHNGLETSAHSPPNAWGSNINGDSIDTADTMLVTPAIDLSGGNLATLRFWQSYDFTDRSEFDIYEYGQVYISTNNSAGWTLLEEFGDASDSWEEAEIDLTPYLGNVIQLGWYYGLFSLEGNPRPGWLIDDVSVLVTNIIPGTIQITNNIAQANFSLSGPISRNGQGLGVVITNAPSGEYVITFNDVPYYTTPVAQTNVLEANQTLLFQGDYTFIDGNANGISDAWEQAFFGSVSPQRTQTTDTDGDGLSDYAEFIAGSNPTNATSSVTLSLPDQQPSGLVQLNWPSTLGHAYRLELSTNAIDWTPLTGWLRATRTNTFQTLPRLTNGPLHLFRLQVRP